MSRSRGVEAPLAEAIVDSIREVTKLRGDVTFRAADELPNDGKVIDDLRKLELGDRGHACGRARHARR